MWFLNIFGSIKNVIIFLVSMLGVSYVAKQKYDAHKAEKKLEKVENDIAKANVIIAKKVAKAKAQSKEIEHKSELKVLRELQAEKVKVLEEMDAIEADIEKSKQEKTKVTGRTKGKKFKVEL
jgi:hypothetical protein